MLFQWLLLGKAWKQRLESRYETDDLATGESSYGALQCPQRLSRRGPQYFPSASRQVQAHGALIILVPISFYPTTDHELPQHVAHGRRLQAELERQA